MANNFEQMVLNYNGLSTETKPTVAGGAVVPNGSRWREVDTGKTWHYNEDDDTWYLSSNVIDKSTHAQITIGYEHHEAHGGSHYFIVGYQTLSINEVLDFTWQMPNTDKVSHWTWSLDTKGETIWLVYEDAVATNALSGTITPYNSNRNSLNTSGTTMKFELQANIGTANADTAIGAATLLESGTCGAGKQQAGTANRENEIILEKNGLYALRAIATAAGYINFNMQWYEHEDKA